MNRRGFLRAAVAAVALTTGLARTNLALVGDKPNWVTVHGELTEKSIEDMVHVLYQNAESMSIRPRYIMIDPNSPS